MLKDAGRLLYERMHDNLVWLLCKRDIEEILTVHDLVLVNGHLKILV